VVEVSYVDKLLEAMTPNRKVEKLLNQKNKIDRELREIREKCNHYQQTIKQVILGEGNQVSTRWVCDECAAVVGYPTDYELNKFLRK
tara:strand:+ start:816 stop:1076 length:261 start_codon:yes stop_codon:yes gene_type:complete